MRAARAKYRELKQEWDTYLDAHPELEERENVLREGGDPDEVHIDREIERHFANLTLRANDLAREIERTEEELENFRRPVAEFYRTAAELAKDVMKEPDQTFRFIPESHVVSQGSRP